MSSVIRLAFFSQIPIKQYTQRSIDNHIALVKKGEVKYTQNKEVLRAGPGELIFIKYRALSTVLEHSEDYERFVIKMSPGLHMMPKVLINAINYLFSDLRVNKLTLKDAEAVAKAEYLFGRIIEEKNKPSTYFHEEMLNALTAELLIFLYNQTPGKEEIINNVNYDVITRIIKEFENAPEAQYSLPELSDKYNLSISGLSHSFKIITGSSIMSYLNFCRINKAKHYLTESDLSISEIVDFCGFPCASSFNRLFKKSTGISPTEYKRIYYKKPKLHQLI